jgi:hypothetical protein
MHIFYKYNSKGKEELFHVYAHDKMFSIQHCVVKFVRDLRQVGGFLRKPPPIKLTVTI